MPLFRFGGLVALVTIAACMVLSFLPRSGLAGGVVTNCATQADLAAKLTGGGLVTFNCGGPTATIPIATTLIVTANTTIDGGGKVTLDGQNSTRILFVNPSSTLTLTNLTLTRGLMPGGFGVGYGGAVQAEGTLVVNGVTFIDNSAGYAGGAISSLYQPVLIENSTFITNTSPYGGGVFANVGGVVRGSQFQGNVGLITGGGYLAAEAGVSSIEGSTFQSNVSTDGGGLLARNPVAIIASTFISNVATKDGGGVQARSTADVAASTFLSNTAEIGGGVRALNPLTVTASTFIGNRATIGGGLSADSAVVVSMTSFLANSAEGGGGAMRAFQSVTVGASTFARNTATTSGGALRVSQVASVSASSFLSNTAESGGALLVGGATVQNSTFAGNQALSGAAIRIANALYPSLIEYSTLAEVLSVNTVISSAAGSSTTIRYSIVTGGNSAACGGGGTFTQPPLSVNFIKDTTCGGLPFSSADPALAALADNGGPTLTQALLPGSLAINAAGPCAVGFDQRGLRRTSPCDVGAYEFGNAPVLTSLNPASANQGGAGFILTVTGSGFISGTAALWNGGVRPTTVLNATTMSVVVGAGDLATSGTAQVQARYGVANDSVSNQLPFTILAPGQPTPTSTPSPTATLPPGQPTFTPSPTATLVPGGQPVARLPIASLNQPAE